MVRAEEPAVGIVVVEENAAALGGGGSHVVPVQHALAAAQDYHVLSEFRGTYAFEIEAGNGLFHGDGRM